MKNKRKILVFAPYFYPHQGGLENFCFEIANRLQQRGFVVAIVTSKINNFKSIEKYHGLNIFRLDSYNILRGTYPIVKLNKNNKKIWKKLCNEGYDVVLTNTRFFILSFLGQRFAKKNKIKSFHIEHGTCHPQLKNSLAKFCAFLYDYSLGKATIKMADQNLAISRAAAKFLKSLGAKNIDIIYNSIDSDFFKPNRDIGRKKILTFVGRLIEGKGVQDLISAFRQLKLKDYELYIVGDGNYKKVLEKIAQKNLSIKFLGSKTPAEVKKILNYSYIFINPSYSEGLPTSVLEAGAMGCAIIATDVGGTAEIIENNRNGYLIPIKSPEIIAKKIKILVTNRLLHDNFCSAINKKILLHFTWNINIDKLIQLLNK